MILYAKDIGEGHSETILFLPGFTGSHESWNENFRALGRQFRLVMIDTLGFGHSPKPDIAYSVDDHVQAIRDTLEQLRVSRCHIVGHSAGCLLALAYAERFPESVGKLALLALPVYRDEQEARQAIKQSSTFNRWLALDTPLAHFVCKLMCLLRPLLLPIMPMLVRDVPAGVAKDALRHTWDSYSRTMRNVIFKVRAESLIAGIEQPILLIHGVKDRTAPIEGVKRLVSEFPKLQFLELAAGHDFIFTHSAIAANAIRQFFLAEQD